MRAAAGPRLSNKRPLAADGNGAGEDLASEALGGRLWLGRRRDDQTLSGGASVFASTANDGERFEIQRNWLTGNTEAAVVRDEVDGALAGRQRDRRVVRQCQGTPGLRIRRREIERVEVGLGNRPAQRGVVAGVAGQERHAGGGGAHALG